jgi:hypothetical protein
LRHALLLGRRGRQGSGAGSQVVTETLDYCNATSADQPLYLIVDSGLIDQDADLDLVVEIGPDATPVPSLTACYPDE